MFKIPNILVSTFLFFFFPDKTVKLWKVSERDKRPEGYNLKDEEGRLRDPCTITTLRVRTLLTLIRYFALQNVFVNNAFPSDFKMSDKGSRLLYLNQKELFVRNNLVPVGTVH